MVDTCTCKNTKQAIYEIIDQIFVRSERIVTELHQASFPQEQEVTEQVDTSPEGDAISLQLASDCTIVSEQLLSDNVQSPVDSSVDDLIDDLVNYMLLDIDVMEDKIIIGGVDVDIVEFGKEERLRLKLIVWQLLVRTLVLLRLDVRKRMMRLKNIGLMPR